MKILLSHDVDWPPNGPGKEHVLARRERFDPSTIEKVMKENFNPYNNISLLMEMEEAKGVRSTFFFRPAYDDGTPISAYADAMKNLVGSGWEIGAHLNDSSSVSVIQRQKEIVDSALGKKTIGCRVHYLKVESQSFSFLKQAGFKYDSSLSYSKDAISEKNTGYVVINGLVVFPITIMDTYLFTYMKLEEDEIIDIFKKAMVLATPHKFMTVLWHDTSLLMRGGRMYGKILEYLVSLDQIEFVTGESAYLSMSEEVTS